MDAIPVRAKILSPIGGVFLPTRPALQHSIILLAIVLLVGCEGRSLVNDNAVFRDLPPRRSLVNDATRNRSANDGQTTDSTIVQVSSSTSLPILEGNTVVAEVNGEPLFVDDIVGSIRLTLETQPQIPDDQRQKILAEQLQQRLGQRIDEEIILHALHKKVPEEQRDALKGHLESHFENYVEVVKKQVGAETPEDFAQKLQSQGMTLALLKETFFRVQMVNGYVESLAETKQQAPPGRPGLLEYYRANINEFTPEERLRWQELRISRTKEDGVQGARARMNEVVQQLKSGQTDFEDLAREYSDSVSAEQNGNKGWLTRGQLADTKLEETLFGLDDGQMTRVIESDDYLSIYRVARHEHAAARPFETVQDEIRQAIRNSQLSAVKQEVLEELKSKASVRTIFDGELDG